MDIRGGAPAIARTGPLMPETLVNKVHGIALFGGSSFGLDAAGGVIRWLRERNVGFDTGHGLVPIVPAAAIFDLALNKKGTQPNSRTGYLACEAAGTDTVEEGCVGAGAGASVGKFYGIKRAMKSGVGSAFAAGFGKIRVGALAVVNALGDVCDPMTGEPVAGVLAKDGKSLLGARDLLYTEDRIEGFPGDNTVLSVVATDAALTKPEAMALARMAHAGLARVVVPAHTMYDGDIVFALSTGKKKVKDLSVLGALAAEVLADAVVRAVKAARPAGGLPAAAQF
jgi:L-aminopeptidase/D-esterase-like protein